MGKRASCGCTLSGDGDDGGVALCAEHWNKTRNYSVEKYLRWADKMRKYIESL